MKMREKTPITLFVDDTTPFINIIYQSLIQNEFAEYDKPDLTFGIYDEFLEERIPIDLLTKFITLLAEFPVKGKMSLIPYPGGLGSLETGLQGVTDAELKRFLQLFKMFVSPNFDVSPEMLTHTRNLQLDTGGLGDLPEHDWSRGRSEEELYRYIRHGVEALQRIGLQPNGVTSPVDFGRGNEANYRRAVQRVFADVSPFSVCWYFLDETMGRPTFLKADVQRYADRFQSVVHVPATVTDHSMELFNLPPSHKIMLELADLYVTKDGKKGMIPEQIAAGSDVISLLFHWPALYLNGRYSGLKLLREVLGRIQQHLREQVIWVTPHQIATFVTELHLRVVERMDG